MPNHKEVDEISPEDLTAAAEMYDRLSNQPKPETIREILIRRDHETPESADELINLAKDQLNKYLEYGDLDLAENICSEYFGLEPDYIDQLM